MLAFGAAALQAMGGRVGWEERGHLVTGGEWIRPEIPDAATRRLLHLGAGSSVLVAERLATAGATPVEWRRSVVRGDRHAFRAAWSPAGL